MMNRRTSIIAALIAAIVACNNDAPPDQQTGSVDSATWSEARAMPADVRAALDSGNAAFRADRFEDARTHYLRAVELGPDQSAAWFGLSMAEQQLGNVAAADSAMQRVQQLSPGASLVHPDEADTMPSGHP
jgi:Flp pilus assembly protein TadD